jgi:hypothetical protein
MWLFRCNGLVLDHHLELELDLHRSHCNYCVGLTRTMMSFPPFHSAYVWWCCLVIVERTMMTKLSCCLNHHCCHVHCSACRLHQFSRCQSSIRDRLTSNDAFEWTSSDICTRKFDRNQVVTRCGRCECHTIAFRHFFTIELNFRRAIDRDCQCTCTRIGRVNKKLAQLS